MELKHQETVLVPRRALKLVFQGKIGRRAATGDQAQKRQSRGALQIEKAESTHPSKIMHLCAVQWRILAILAAVLTTVSLEAQPQPVGEWRVHLPLRQTHSIAVLDDYTLAASPYGLIVYDQKERATTLFSLSEGLSNLGVTTIEAGKDGKSALIGYDDGQVDIWTPNNYRIIPDIPQSGQYLGKTKVYDFAVANATRAYVATGFGVVELNLELGVVKGTYIMTDDGTTTEVRTISVARDTIWAGTSEGLMKAYVHAPLYLASSWIEDAHWAGVPLTSISATASGIAVVPDTSTTAYYRLNGQAWQTFNLWGAPQYVRRVRAAASGGGSWAVVRAYDLMIFDANMQPLQGISGGMGNNAGFSPHDVGYSHDWERDVVWIANDTRGLTIIDNPDYAMHRQPVGPPRAEVYKVSYQHRGMDVMAGALDATWSATYIRQGVDVFDREAWRRYPASLMNHCNDVVASLVNPNDTTHWFACSWGQGVFEFRDGGLYKHWTHTNSTLQKADGSGASDDVRVGGAIWGHDGAVWLTNSLTSTPLHRYDPVTEQWTSYSLGQINGLNVRTLIQDVDEQFWIMTRTGGVAAVKIEDQTAQVRRMKSGQGSGNLPSERMHDIVLDQDGELWLGTDDGMVICYTPYSAFTGASIDAQPILVDENGIVQKVLGGQSVTSFAIDGANRKWVGTGDAGLFLLSSDGLETIEHFTKDNAPLPSNNIKTLAIDPITGELFVGTSAGLVSYRGTATAAAPNADDVQIFPNPIRPGYSGPMTIRGLTEDSDIVVTNSAGNMVSRGYATGGQWSWDTRTLDGAMVPSGIYLFWVSGPNGAKVAIAQGVIVR